MFSMLLLSCLSKLRARRSLEYFRLVCPSPVSLQGAVPRHPVTLLQLVPEGRHQAVEGMSDNEQTGHVTTVTRVT